MTPLICAWAAKHKISQEAVKELMTMMGVESTHAVTGSDKPEARVQDAARLEASKLGWRLWRQNVGALKDETGRIVRYGLCNDTPAMNKRIKSSDLIGIRPVIITPDMVGTTLGQFLAREIKRESWKYKGTEHEQAQLRFGEIVTSLGGDFKFYNGSSEL